VVTRHTRAMFARVSTPRWLADDLEASPGGDDPRELPPALREFSGELDAITAGEDVLGEGPHWAAAPGRLLRVDILGRLVVSLDPGDGEQERTSFDDETTFVVPRIGGGLAVGVPSGVLLLDAAGRLERSIELSSEPEQHRVNDAKADTAGRLWVSTQCPTGGVGGDHLHRLDIDGSSTIAVSGVSNGNGLGWSPDGKSLYFIDSLTQRVDVFDFDIAAGTVSGQRTFIEVPASLGVPDGMTVDAEGGVWVALFFGGAVHRYTPAGELDLRIELPTSHPTSLAFGGDELRELFVTTAQFLLPARKLAAEPLAGAVFRLRPGMAGLPAHAFGG
jgi:sugar lactone lactonase YvrE